MCNLGAKLRFFHHIYKLILSNFEVSPSKTIYYHGFQASLFPKRLKHLGDTLFFLFHVRVNIEVEGCCDVGMTEQYAYCLVVAVAFNAAYGKVVVRSVTINQVKQELNATSKNMQDRLHTMGKNPQKKIVTNCLRILDNVYDCVTKCLLTPFKSVEQSKLHHACLSKKNCSFY